jgi:DNA-3-methyladenine glycosylase II
MGWVGESSPVLDPHLNKMFTLSFYLKPNRPFRLDFTVWALRRLPHNAVDRWDGRMYTRILVITNETIRVDIGQPTEHRIRVNVRTEKNFEQSNLKEQVTALVEKMLGIRKDLREFYALAEQDRNLVPLVTRFKGLKPPRFPSVFEAVINAIACQQLSLHVGIELLNRLTKIYGRVWGDDEAIHAFPLPQDIAQAPPSKLRSLGFSSSKVQAIITIARDIVKGEIDLEKLAAMDDADAADYLPGLKGIGRWSAEYVMLRGLGRINIFPGDDIGAQNNLQRLLHLKEKPGYDKIRMLTRRWHPYAGFCYFHFLLNKLEGKGLL